MSKRARSKNREGFRICFGCRVEFELSPENFHAEKCRIGGLAYRCKGCQSIASKKKLPRPERWQNMTPEQKSRRSGVQKKYYHKASKSRHRVWSYRAIDKRKGMQFDLDVAWYEENIHGKPCHYCSDIESPLGCDRIDNKQGHTRNNVVPCCFECNVTRMDNYSYEEMIVLGETIRVIKERRKQVRASLESGTAYV